MRKQWRPVKTVEEARKILDSLTHDGVEYFRASTKDGTSLGTMTASQALRTAKSRGAPVYLADREGTLLGIAPKHGRDVDWEVYE